MCRSLEVFVRRARRGGAAHEPVQCAAALTRPVVVGFTHRVVAHLARAPCHGSGAKYESVPVHLASWLILARVRIGGAGARAVSVLPALALNIGAVGALALFKLRGAFEVLSFFARGLWCAAEPVVPQAAQPRPELARPAGNVAAVCALDRVRAAGASAREVLLAGCATLGIWTLGARTAAGRVLAILAL